MLARRVHNNSADEPRGDMLLVPGTMIIASDVELGWGGGFFGRMSHVLAVPL